MNYGFNQTEYKDLESQEYGEVCIGQKYKRYINQEGLC